MAALLIAVVGILPYLLTFRCPFILDDWTSIVHNTTLRHLWPPGPVFSPPGGGVTVDARPVLNLTFALNYAISGTNVWSYHAANLLIHILAALVLFGILRRAFGSPAVPARVQGAASSLALAAATLWVVHPLNTAAVTYIVQRAESLMGLFFLLTFYLTIRGASAERPRPWYGTALLACILGMACKEVMATAPPLLLVYDRIFLAGSWRDVWRNRKALHLCLAASLVIPVWLTFLSHGRDGTGGFSTTVTVWSYLCTQFGNIVHYLALCFRPVDLVIDYGTGLSQGITEVLPQAVTVVLLGLAVLAALRRAPALGYTGLWFFGILAPTSSIIPIATEPGAEHRMYLPLAAVTALAVVAAHRVWAAASARLAPLRQPPGRCTPVAATSIIVLVLGVMTLERNLDFRTPLALWEDTVRKRPVNVRALCNLASVHRNLGDTRNEYDILNRAIALNPHMPEALIWRGNIHLRMNRPDAAIADYTKAIRLSPANPDAYRNRARAYATQGHLAEAAADLVIVRRTGGQIPADLLQFVADPAH